MKRRALAIVVIVLILISCCALTLLAGSGFWQAVNYIIANIISQGPASIVSAIFTIGVIYVCGGPILAILLIVAVIALYIKFVM